MEPNFNPCQCPIDEATQSLKVTIDKIFIKDWDWRTSTVCKVCNPNYICPECGSHDHVWCHEEEECVEDGSCCKDAELDED